MPVELLLALTKRVVGAAPRSPSPTLVRLENFIDEAALKKLPNAFENIVE
jgi:hypothetical protein